MKKYIIIAASALALAACSGTEKEETVDINDYVTSDVLHRPIAASATLLGWQAKEQFKNESFIDSTLNREEYLRGFRYGIEAEANSSFAMGLKDAQQFYQVITSLKQQGLDIDPDQIYKAYRAAFLADSVPAADVQAREMEAASLWKEFEDSMAAYEKAKVELSAEAKANVKRGAEYIDSLAAQGWTITESGIAYLVDSLADGKKITEADRFYLTFTTRSISGQKAHNYNSRPMMLSFFEDQPGFVEAVQLAPAGSKVQAVVPGPLAFGTNMPYNIGPNEAIVVELCVDSIYAPAPAQHVE
ncbi:MAG: hypothetical protein K2N16_02310 [Muribaculaceae bacterium]|nr:hypothetical protein [Muribaculaceae bacterium]